VVRPVRASLRLGWPLSFAQMNLSDREQQLTLIRTLAATLFDVCLLFVLSARALRARF
jgi:hypothetical protein